jgi:CBS domain containing-hemolysin-like protein
MEIALLVFGLILSAFCSGTETALVSTTLIEAEIWLKKKRKAARWVYYFLSHPDRYLITILVGNNIGIVLFSSVATHYLSPYIGYFLILVFNSFFLLLFGEILPKTLMLELARKAVRFLVLPLILLRWLFWPLYPFLYFISRIVLKLAGERESGLQEFLTKKDLEVLLREGANHGVVAPEERKIISRVFRFSNRKVREVLVPRTEMVCVPATASIAEVKKTIMKSGHSRLPVYGKNLDDIRGAVYAKDLLLRPKRLKDILRDVLFVPQGMLCSELLKQMRAKHQTIAIVVDEYGGTAGLVTIEDLVEELFGEISDEYDGRAVRIRRLADGSVLASARTEVHVLNDELEWELPLGAYETVGGMILSHIGRIPHEGEIVKIDGYEIEILRADRKRIRFVKIRQTDGAVATKEEGEK